MNDETEELLLRKIEDVVLVFLTDLAEDRVPAIGSPNGTRLELKPGTAERCAVVMKVISEIYFLLINNQYSTKRDIFYNDKSFFEDQRHVDRAVTVVCRMLGEDRLRLHVLSTAKGCVVGDLAFEDGEGNRMDCRGVPVLLPTHVHQICNLVSDARFLLVVEKDATFQKLLDENFLQKAFPSILLTGKGYPDINTRLFIQLLVRSLAIPVFALMDADPHGIEIFITYKYGPKKATRENENLEIPEMEWIGLFRSEAEKLPLGHQMLQLSLRESRKLTKLLERQDIANNPLIVREIACMQKSNTKLEIEAISSLYPFCLSEYLHKKLYPLPT